MKKATEAAPTGVERRRGLLAFLTWAFFLPELFGRDGVTSGAAHASEPDPAGAAHPSAQPAPAPNSIVDRSVTSTGEEAEQTASVSPGYTLTVGSPLNAGPPTLGVSGADETGSRSATPSGGDVPGGSGGGGAAVSEPHHMSDAASTTVVPDAPVLSGTLSAEGLLDGVANTLGAVPIVGELLSSTIGSVSETVTTLAKGLTAPIEGLGDTLDGILGSDGVLSFGSPTSSEPGHDLETAEGFTDYGIALELDLAEAPSFSIAPAPSDNHASALSANDDHVVSHLASDDPILQDDIAQRSSADVLA